MLSFDTDSAPVSTPYTEYLWNLCFAAHPFCSHPSTGHPHLFPEFLQDLPHQPLCLQSLSTHHFLYTAARMRFPKSNLIRSTTLLQNTFMRFLLSSSFQDIISGARKSEYVCSMAFGEEGPATQRKRAPLLLVFRYELGAPHVPYIDISERGNL